MSQPLDIPQKTQAIQFSRTGGPEVIESVEVDTPTPKPDEFLIRMEWGGVNFIDTYFREGLYPTPSLPFTLGAEGSGVVVSLPTSEEVLETQAYKRRALKVGDKVVVNGGNFQGYVAVSWLKVIPLPQSISTRVGAASFTQGLTALTFAQEAYAVQKGDWVLVHAAAGGFGLQLVQIIKKLGGNVIGTTSTPEKAQLAKAYGADHVVLYTQDDVAEAVLRITNGGGVNAVFDGVGKDTWEDNFKLIARKGTIVSVGNSSGFVPPFPPVKLASRNIRIVRPTLGNYIFTPEETDFYSSKYWQLVEEGLKVQIHKEYPFSAEGVRQAQVDLKGRGTSGKLLINIGGST